MAFTGSEIAEIRALRDKGLSASKIAKTIHRRKQSVLDQIRRIEVRPKSIRQTHLFKEPINQGAVNAFIDALYREGYPKEFIKKLVHKKHPSASKKYIERRMNSEPKEVLSERRETEKEVRKLGKEYTKNRQEGRYFRETEQYIAHPVNWDIYHSMVLA